MLKYSVFRVPSYQRGLLQQQQKGNEQSPAEAIQRMSTETNSNILILISLKK